MTLGCGMCFSFCLDCLQSHLAPASHRAVKLNHSWWGIVEYFICSTEGLEEGKDRLIIETIDREPRVQGQKDRQ